MLNSDQRRPGVFGAAAAMADRLLAAAFVGALVVLAFVGGALLTAAGTFPGAEIARAYQGARAVYSRFTEYRDVHRSDLWYPERRADRGVTVHDPAAAQPGVTLYTSGHEAAAFLVAMDGEILHEWRRPFSTVDRVADGRKLQPDAFVYFRKAVVFPNGDLLAIYEGVGDTPYGYGVVKLDRDSNVLWSYDGDAHHDLDVGPDGRIYVLTQAISTDELVNLDRLAPPRLDDFLVVLSPDGEELRKLRLIDVVAASEYRQVLYTVSAYAVADPLHANSVDVVTDAQAANFPFADPGQVLLSFRELGAVAVLDLATARLVWMTRGPWIGQHDADILPDGNVLLFDNYANYRRPEGVSRVIEFDPETMKIVWQYSGDEARPLDSLIRSDQERLPNGNTLITESNGGRIVEVTRSGEIVWEYLNPVRHRLEDGETLIPIICWAARLDPVRLDPTLTGGTSARDDAPPAPTTQETDL